MRLYTDLAPWFHLLTHPSSYGDEAAFVTRVVEEVVEGEARTLLELGSGGGNNASHLKARFECTLSDVSPDMLALSKTLNPECEHLVGDMRTLRLGRTFDVVFVHDAISYLTTEDDLRQAIETTAAHVRPGGVVVLTPDATTEIFRPGTDHGGHDGEDGRSLRFLEWTHAPDPAGSSTYTVDYAIVDAGPGGTTRDRPRPAHARRLPGGDVEAPPRRRGARGRRNDHREPVRARAGGIRCAAPFRLTPSGRTSTLDVEHTFVPETGEPRCRPETRF